MSTTTHPAFSHPGADAVTAMGVAVNQLLDAALWSLSAGQLALLVVGLERQARRVCATSTAAAFAAGDIGFDGAVAVCAAVEGLPGEVLAALTGRIEQLLVGVAREDGARAVVQEAASIVYRFAPDHLQELEQRQNAANRLVLVSRHDGTVAVRGHLDKEAGALGLAVLGPLAKPVPVVGGVPDQRTAGTRYAEAFIQVLQLAGAATPDVRGDRPTVITTISLATRPL
jgi:hypothetical protein